MNRPHATQLNRAALSRLSLLYSAADRHGTPARQGWAALVLLVLLATPPLRQTLEASMARHMLLQFPLFMLAGVGLAGSLPAAARAAIARWNAYGISGLVATALVLGLLMVPRVLDLALVSPAIEWAKCSALVLTGAALRLSWRPAGLVVQGFFLGNLLPMMAVVGQLYVDSPTRVCNAYLLDDQEQLGHWLVWLAVVIAVAWLAWMLYSMVRRDAALQAPDMAAEPLHKPSATVNK